MKPAIVFLLLVSSSQADRARVIVTKAYLKLLRNAVSQFQMDIGRLPAASEGLNALIAQPARTQNWPAGGYLETAEVPKDAWGNEFRYVLDPNLPGGFGIYSCGRDGMTATNGNDRDDLHTWITHTRWPPYYETLALKQDRIEGAMSLAIVLLILAAMALIL